MRPFTLHHSPFTVHYLFTVHHEAQRLIANSKCMVNSKRLIANGAGGAW